MLAQVFDQSPVAGEIELWPQLKLTPQQEKQWGEFKAAMLWAVPSFSDIWLAMMVDKYCNYAWFTDRIPTAATDDKYLYLNPTWFFALTLDEQLFVACHEVDHAIFNHAGMSWLLEKEGKVRYDDGTVLPYDGDLMNVVMDYVINDQLVQAKIGKMPEGGCHWPAVVNGDMGVLDAYRVVYKRKQSQQPRSGQGKPNPMGNSGSGSPSAPSAGGRPGQPESNPSDGPGQPFDKLLRPGQGRGKSANKAVSERSNAEWDVAVTAAMEAAKLRGQLPANLDRMFNKRLQPKAEWRDLYRLAVSRKVGNDRYTWDVLNQQLAYRRIGSPGRTAYGCQLIVLVDDVSGSITQRTLDVIHTEDIALLEQAKPKRIIYGQCDADIKMWEEMDSADQLMDIKVKGGGGTDFRPVFKRIEEEGLEPDLLVYMTDLYGEFPKHAPPYPVIWAVVDNPDGKPPFGEVVYVPQQAEM